MSKIKEIQDRLLKNPIEYSEIRFTIAKQIFALNVALYFLAYLFTVWGFYFGPISRDGLAIIRYHLYSLLIISTIYFGYSLAEFGVARYMPEKKIILIVVAVIGTLLGLVALAAHLGFLA